MSGIQVCQDANPGHISVYNDTSDTFNVRVTSYTTRGGSDKCFSIPTGRQEVWGRGEENGYEGVFFSQPASRGPLNCFIYVKNGSSVTVRNLRNQQRPSRLADCNMSYSRHDKLSLVVHNTSNEPIKAFVSSFSHSGGNESWFDIGPGRTETWNRGDTEMVVVTRARDFHDRSKRVGTWLDRGETLTISKW